MMTFPLHSRSQCCKVFPKLIVIQRKAPLCSSVGIMVAAVFISLILTVTFLPQVCRAEAGANELQNEGPVEQEIKEDLISNLEKTVADYKNENAEFVDSIKANLKDIQHEMDLSKSNQEHLKESLGTERFILDQKEKTLALFFQIISIVLAVFGLIFVVLGFVGFRSIREMKAESQKTEKEFLGQSQKLIKDVMAADFGKTIGELEKKIYKLECFNEFLKIGYANQKRAPAVPESEENGNPTAEEPTNTFDQP